MLYKVFNLISIDGRSQIPISLLYTFQVASALSPVNSSFPFQNYKFNSFIRTLMLVDSAKKRFNLIRFRIYFLILILKELHLTHSRWHLHCLPSPEA